MNSILVIYEKSSNCEHIIKILKNNGYQVDESKGSLQGIENLRKQKNFNVVILDQYLKDIDTISLIQQLRSFHICIPFVYLAKDESYSPQIESALQNGANDFLFQKDLPSRILNVVKFFDFYDILNQELDFRSRIKGKRLFSTIISKSGPMRVCVKAAQNASKVSKNVYLYGEKGTGKEDLARAIHENSSFSSGNFVILQCLDFFNKKNYKLDESQGKLIEDCINFQKNKFYDNVFYKDIYPIEIDEKNEDFIKNSSQSIQKSSYPKIPKISGNFIHKGVFDDISNWESYAKKQFFYAQKGTLCLLGIESLTAEQQRILAVILSFYAYKKKRPFRIISLSTLTRDELLNRKKFSISLLKHLGEITIGVPSLKQRREDLPDLSMNILREMNLEKGNLHHIHGISGAVLATFMQKNWNQNIPELEDLLFRVSLISSGPLITLNDLSYVNGQKIRQQDNSKTVEDNLETYAYLKEDGHVKTLACVEKELIEASLKRYQYRISEAARRLKIGRATFYRKLEEYNTKEKK